MGYTYTLNNLQDTVTFRNSVGLVTSFYDYDYDVRDRLVKRTDMIESISRSINYGYDIASNRTSVTTASGTTIYTYDERNRLDLVKLNGVLQANYDYDAGSNLVQTTFGNGTRENRSYDTLNRLTALETKRLSDNVQLLKYVYTLDKVGDRKSVTEVQSGQSRNLVYTYDDLYRLTGETITDATDGNRTSTYVYDKVGNRLTKTVNGTTTAYIYDANDRLLNEKINGVVSVANDYDNNGSTLTKTENGGTTTYVWNDEKRLIAANVNGTQVEYRYNDQGIRVSSKQNGVETRYLLDEGMTANVWEEYAPNSAVQTTYSYGYDLITQTQANQTSYYLVDGLGSTRLLTDAQGQVLNSYEYEAFGETMSQSGIVSNKYQFAGEQFDATLGDYYLRQRLYDTSNGRFGRIDTYETGIGDLNNLNKYVYAGNNPATNTDPSGFFLISPGYGMESAIQSELERQRTVQTAITLQTVRSQLIQVAGAVATALAKALEISVTTARTLNRQFGIPVVFWGNDLPETTDHQFRAIMGRGYTINNVDGSEFGMPISPALHRRGLSYDRTWLGGQPQAQGRSQAQQCDEFPYAITEEGGQNNYQRDRVSLHILNGRQNGRNGRWLQTFMNRAGVTPLEVNARYSLFLNIPVPSLGISFGLGRAGEPISIFDGQR